MFDRRSSLRQASISFAHPLQESPFIAPVVDQHGVLDGREDAKEFVPNLFLLVSVFSPEAVLLDQGAGSDPCADEIVEIAIG